MQVYTYWKWRLLVAKFTANCAILWPNLQLFQVVPSDGKTDPVVYTLKWSTNLMEGNFGNQKMLTTVWWRWGAALLTSMKTSTTCPPSKQPLVVVHHIVIVLQCLIISWEKLIIDKIIQPKSNESMWYFRPLELLEGFFSSVFKLVVLEFISWKASLLNDEHVCRETTSSWARVVALLAAERLFSQMG